MANKYIQMDNQTWVKKKNIHKVSKSTVDPRVIKVFYTIEHYEKFYYASEKYRDSRFSEIIQDLQN